MNEKLNDSPKRRNPSQQPRNLKGLKKFHMEQLSRLKTSLSNQAYLNTYLPLLSQSSLPEHILGLLRNAGMYRNNSWVDIPISNKEEDIYRGLVNVLEKIRASAEANLPNLDRIPGKWVDTHDVALDTWSRSGVSGLRPDVSFAHNDTDKDKVFWSRVYSVIEVKVSADKTDTASLAAQLAAYVGHIFAEQVDRLFVNALTLCGRKLQISRYDRSGVVVLHDAINIDMDPLNFVQIIASFSYLSPTDLGWDPTCMIWNTEEQVPLPSYNLPKTTFQFRDVYDLPWVFRVDEEDYVAIGPINGNRPLSIWGRATFVVHAVELKDWKNRNGQAKVYILKQCWQRLPGLGTAPKTAALANSDNSTTEQLDEDPPTEDFGDIYCKPFEAFAMERAGWKERIRASWCVELNGEPITTFKTIRKNIATSIPPPPRQRTRSGTETSTSTTWGSSRTPGPLKTIDDTPNHPTLVTRTLVRLVFDRPGWPIERFKSKLELLLSLRGIVTELETLHKNGVVHRDVSPSNLIISESGGHVIDFDHSKIGFVTEEVGFEKVTDEDVVEVATKILHDGWFANSYIDSLKRLWGIQNRSPTREDFGWPEKADPVYLFNNRRLGDGFVTGTYEFISGHLPNAPYHHSGHDLDSLWWDVNIMFLRLEGPGGKERENPPHEVISTYYTGGPGKKWHLLASIMGGGQELTDMMAEWSAYFEDLKPFMKKWASFLYIALTAKSFEHYHPHRYLIKIIDEAIQEMEGKEETGYEKAAEKEGARREKEKADMAEAICKQITIPILLERKGTTEPPVEGDSTSDLLPNTANADSESESEPYTTDTPLSPERNPIPLTTVYSPERDRAVKRARSGSYRHKTRD